MIFLRLLMTPTTSRTIYTDYIIVSIYQVSPLFGMWSNMFLMHILYRSTSVLPYMYMCTDLPISSFVIESSYNTVQYNKISNRVEWWRWYDEGQILNSRKTPHMLYLRAKYLVPDGIILEVVDRIVSGPHSIRHGLWRLMDAMGLSRQIGSSLNANTYLAVHVNTISTKWQSCFPDKGHSHYSTYDLTHCDLVTTYGVINLGHYCFR